MSNIEEDIKRCEKLIEPQNANWIGITNQLAIAHLIEKVKELRAMCEEYCPKTERIKELEEENKIYILNGDNVKLELYIKENYIPVQKIKDKIEENKDTAKRVAGTYQYADSGDDLEEKKSKVIELRTKAEALEELLEDK